MAVRRRSKRLVCRSRGSDEEVNIANGRNNYKKIVGTRSAKPDMRPFNATIYTDRRTNMVEESPPALSVLKPVRTDSSTITLLVKCTSSESEQLKQEEKSMENSSVDLTERLRREHERVLQTR